MPEAKIEAAILKSMPGQRAMPLDTFELTPLAGGTGNGGRIVDTEVSSAPDGREPLRILAFENRRESLKGRLLSAFLGRRPDWSHAKVEQVTSSANEAFVQVGGQTYFEIGWKVTLPEGRGEARYFEQTKTKLEELSAFVVKAFSKNKWTKTGDATGQAALVKILDQAKFDYQNKNSRTTEDVIAVVRDEMRERLRSIGPHSDAEVHIIVDEVDAVYEIGLADQFETSGYN